MDKLKDILLDPKNWFITAITIWIASSITILTFIHYLKLTIISDAVAIITLFFLALVPELDILLAAIDLAIIISLLFNLL